MKHLLIATLGCFLLLGCASQKKVADKEEKTRQQTAVKENVQEQTERQTTTYGDSLTGNGFVSADDPNPAPITAESKGLKVNIKLKPRYDQEGKLQGFQAEYQTTAKPTSIVNENHSSSKTTQAKQNTRSQDKASDTQVEKKGSVLTILLAGVSLTLLLILFLVWLKSKI